MKINTPGALLVSLIRICIIQVLKVFSNHLCEVLIVEGGAPYFQNIKSVALQYQELDFQHQTSLRNMHHILKIEIHKILTISQPSFIAFELN